MSSALEVLAMSLGLLPNQPSLPPPESHLLQIKIVSGQSSKDDLVQRLLEDANKKAEKDPMSAVPFYTSHIVLNTPAKEEATRKLFSIYEKLVFQSENPTRWVFENALFFYDRVIEEHEKNPANHNEYIALAYLYSGRIICCMKVEKGIRDGVNRLKMAYAIAESNDTKAQAILTLSYVARHLPKSERKKLGLKTYSEYLKDTQKHAEPGSNLWKHAERTFNGLEYQKPKNLQPKPF